MSLMQPARGTYDLAFDAMKKHRYICQQALELSSRYGFDEIKTPIFEFSHVFTKTLGDSSDVVSKQMYTFTDKGGDEISLRPEGTAGVMRAFISEGMAQKVPLKLFYEGPMFRYERPQKGRYRQFYQIGVELLGSDALGADIEVISLAHSLLSGLGLKDLVQLEVNSIGDKESRDAYRKILVNYYESHKTRLSEESLRRLVQNPLRILDSKDEGDQSVNAGAPRLQDHLNDISKSKFDGVLKGLKSLGVSYHVNPLLVRGLDYYCHTVFEFRTQALGSQDAVLSGGRYDGLCELMGGGKTPSVGWGAGVDRLALLLKEFPHSPRPISIIPLGAAAESWAMEMAHNYRAMGCTIDLAFSGNMSNRMKKANGKQAIAALIVGDNELQSKQATLKILDSGTQETISFDRLEARVRSFFK